MKPTHTLSTVLLLAVLALSGCKPTPTVIVASSASPTVAPAATATAAARPTATSTAGPAGGLTQTVPAIVVTSPKPNDTVSSPLRVQGNASVFEAHVNLRLIRVINGTTEVLVDTFATASEGAPGRGTFSTDLAFRGSGQAVLQAFNRSARDGTVQNLVEVPVRLEAP